MAEIKSTLDLIMEKTKHLTLSEEEKAALRKKELQTRIGAIIQQYLDGTKTPPEVKEALQNLSAEGKTVQTLIREEIIARWDPREENEALIDLLKDVLPEEITFFQSKDRAFKEKITAIKAERMQELLTDFTRQGISGSALIPNLERDEKWKRLNEDSLRLFREELSRAFQIN